MDRNITQACLINVNYSKNGAISALDTEKDDVMDLISTQREREEYFKEELVTVKMYSLQIKVVY